MSTCAPLLHCAVQGLTVPMKERGCHRATEGGGERVGERDRETKTETYGQTDKGRQRVRERERDRQIESERDRVGRVGEATSTN